MYKSKAVEYGFVVLCPERNIGGLKATVRSIHNHCSSAAPILCVAPKNTNRKEHIEMKGICDTIKCSREYHSMKEEEEDVLAPFINKGVDKSASLWLFIIIAGSHVKLNFYRKYSYFIEDEKDILFPIVDRQCNFKTGTYNGLLFHKSAIKEIGNFDEDMPFQMSKIIWGKVAQDKGYTFKALLGARIL